MNRRDALKTFAAVAAGGSLPVVGACETVRTAIRINTKPITLPPITTWYVKFDCEDGYRRILEANESGFIYGPVVRAMK